MADTLEEIFDSLRKTPKEVKWEYLTNVYFNNHYFDNEMTELGKYGWEAYAVQPGDIGVKVYFKRQIK